MYWHKDAFSTAWGTSANNVTKPQQHLDLPGCQ